MVADGFQDSFQVAYRDTLPEQVREYLLEIAHGDDLGYRVVHHDGVGLFDVVQHGVYVLTREELMRIALHDLRPVGYHDGNRVDEGVSGDVRHDLLVLGYPLRRESESRLHGVDSIDLLGNVAAVQRQVVIHQYLAARDFLALDLDDVHVRVDLGIIRHSHGGDHHTHIQRELLSEYDHALDEVSAGFLIDKPQQAVAELHLDRLDIEQLEHIVDVAVVVVVRRELLHLLFFRLLALGKLQLRHFLLVAVEQECRQDKQHAQDKAYHRRESRNDHHDDHDDAGDHQHERLRRELALDVVDKAVLARRAGNNHTGGNGDQQRRYLGAESVADRCQGIGVKYRVEITAAAHHSDDNAADEVHEGRHDGHYRVALYELGGTVHGAVEVRLALYVVTAALGFLLVDYAGVEVGVYRHLLTGHCVQGESRSHLGYSLGALGDYDEVYQYDDYEYQEADDGVAAHYELSEGGDYAAGVSAGEYSTGGGNVQRQSQHRGQQQDCREYRELQRLPDEHGHYQNDKAQRDVEQYQEVQQPAGERNNDGDDDEYNEQHERVVQYLPYHSIISSL